MSISQDNAITFSSFLNKKFIFTKKFLRTLLMTWLTGNIQHLIYLKLKGILQLVTQWEKTLTHHKNDGKKSLYIYIMCNLLMILNHLNGTLEFSQGKK